MKNSRDNLGSSSSSGVVVTTLFKTIIISVFVLGVVIHVGEDCLINGSGKLLDRKGTISGAVKVVEDLLDFIIGDHDAFDLGEEIVELSIVELSAAVSICKLHPVEGDLLDCLDREGLASGLGVQSLNN